MAGELYEATKQGLTLKPEMQMRIIPILRTVGAIICSKLLFSFPILRTIFPLTYVQKNGTYSDVWYAGYAEGPAKPIARPGPGLQVRAARSAVKHYEYEYSYHRNAGMLRAQCAPHLRSIREIKNKYSY